MFEHTEVEDDKNKTLPWARLSPFTVSFQIRPRMSLSVRSSVNPFICPSVRRSFGPSVPKHFRTTQSELLAGEKTENEFMKVDTMSGEETASYIPPRGACPFCSSQILTRLRVHAAIRYLPRLHFNRQTQGKRFSQLISQLFQPQSDNSAQ